MAGSKESDGGCLSILSSCFRNSAKTRPEASKSPNHELTPKVTEPLAPELVTNQVHTPTKPTLERPVSQPAESLERPSTTHENESIPLAPALNQELATALDLWQKACDEVDEKTRRWIENHTGSIDVGNPISELVKLVQRSEERHTEKSWRVKVGEREIVLRDYTSRVTSWLTTIGDLAITFAPMPSPVIWSAVKVLLKANVSHCEDLVSIMGCTDMVLSLVRRGKVYEEIYLRRASGLPVNEDLKQKLVTAYKACLEFLAYVDEELRRGNLRHFFNALLNPGHGEQHISYLKDLEQDLELAAYACEVKSNQVRSEEHRKLLQGLQAPLMRIDSRVAAVLEKLGEEKKEKIMKYISTIPVGIHHNEKRESRTKDTCEWLIRHPKFREWEDSSCSSVLWLQGSIGTGKSFLSSKVIDRYLANGTNTDHWPGGHDEGFAFFYCSRSDRSRQETPFILRSYIRQLSEVPRHSKSVHKAAIGLYQDSKKIQTDLTIEKCRSTLLDMTNSYPRTILVLDALDECDETTKKDLAKLFQDLIENSKSLLKVFIASRKEPDIEEYLDALRSPRMLVSINASDNSGDIEKFVTDEIARFTVNWQYIHDNTKVLVKTALVEKGDGMFRWTYLQWEQLKKCRIDIEVRRRLNKIQKLPKTLSAAYDELYDQYEPDDFQLVILQRAVRWVMCARKPLGSSALLSAIRAESEKMDGEKAVGKEDLTEHTLEWVCQHLIVKDSALGVWKFPHASVAEYFKDKEEPWVKDAPAEIAMFLINCLIDCCAACPSVWPPPAIMKRCERGVTASVRDSDMEAWIETGGVDPHAISDPRHPLQKYTQEEWLNHMRNISDQDSKITDVVQTLKRFLGEKGPQKPSKEYQVFCTYIVPGRWSYYDNVSSRIQPPKNATFGIIAMGLYRLLSGWWDLDLDPSQVNCVGQDLLAMAVEYGHKDICEDLANRHFNINGCVDSLCSSPLGMTIFKGQIEIMRLLLAKGANPNLSLKTHRHLHSAAAHTFLCWAKHSGEEYVKVLLEFGADPNVQCGSDCIYGCVLLAAAHDGKVGTVEALIRNGAEINPTPANPHIGTPLVAAVRQRHFECAYLLVEHGADVNTPFQDRYHGSILAATVGNGNVDLARLLIEHGADVHVHLKTGDYGSILAAAALGKDSTLAMVKYLIEEAHTELEQLIWKPPPGARHPTDLDLLGRALFYLGNKRSINLNRAEKAEYFINERQVEARVLVDIGLLDQAEVVDNTLVVSGLDEPKVIMLKR